ncbi:M56 family metallopeptidase [Flavobacteriaceae bacterium GSB9]|nr:M56 family metallopeptidase [Flavobacteriaceae bacterium GSB9]
MLHYILQTIAFQAFFLLVYDLFLRKETFFNCNRAYLLATPLLSLLIPLVEIEQFKNMISQEFIFTLPEILVGEGVAQAEGQVIQLEPVVVSSPHFWSWNFLFYLGMALALVFFIFKMAKLLALLYKNPKVKKGDLLIVSLINSSAAFSFFRCVFLGDHIKANQKASILKHEMVHVKQNHTLDLLFFELLRVPFWFNPLVYIYQNRMVELHEFIADAHAVKQNKTEYYQNLLSQVFDTKNISFINPFYKQSLIKKRIVMLQKSKSKQFNLLKYVLLIPLVLGMLVYTSCHNQEETKVNSSSDDALIKELMSEYTNIKNSGADKGEVFKAFHRKVNIEKCTKEEFYRMRILLNIELKDNPYIAQNSRDLFNKTYEEYLEWKNTDEAKKIYRKASNPDFFIFKSQQQTNSNKMPEPKHKNIEGNVPFSIIEQPPVFPGCEDLQTNEERKKCISEKINEFVAKKFNTDLGKDLDLTGRQRIVVKFKIDQSGVVVEDEIAARGSHIELENEAIRVIKELPRMAPGKQEGKNVNVLYSLPIIFEMPE